MPTWLKSQIIEPLLFGLPTDWNKYTRKVRRYAEQARVPMPERLQTYNFLHMQSPASVFEPEFLNNIDDRAPIDAMTRWYDRNSDTDLVNRMLAYDWKVTLADNDIRKVNRMCDLAGVKVAYPLLDDDLVKAGREYAQRHKTSLNALLRRMLEEKVRAMIHI